MAKRTRQRLNREDWLQGTLKVLEQHGVDGVKIVIIAERMGVTSGSFYWHFKGLRDLLDCLLEYWERELAGCGHGVYGSQAHRQGHDLEVHRRGQVERLRAAGDAKEELGWFWLSTHFAAVGRRDRSDPLASIWIAIQTELLHQHNESLEFWCLPADLHKTVG